MIQENTLALLRSFLLDLTENLTAEITALLLFLLTYILARVAIRKALEGTSRRLRLAVELALYLGSYVLTSHLHSVFSQIRSLDIALILLYLSVVWVLFEFLGEFLSFGNVSRWIFKLSLLLNALALFLQDLSRGDERFYSSLFKFSVVLMLSVILLNVHSHLLNSIGREFPKRVIRRASPVLLLLYLILALAWVLGTVSLSQDTVVRVVSLTGALVAYFLLQVYLATSVEKHLGHEADALKRSIRRFMGVFSVFVLFKGLDLLFDTGSIKSFLSGIHIVDTELVKISLLSILESVYLFVLLLALTQLLRDLISVYFQRKGMEVEAGSFGALASNVGIFLALVIALVHLGITWKVLFPLAGALGIGLGFGLQTIFNNYVSGFILLLSKNIKVGDLVELEGSAGRAIGRSGETIFGKVVNINVLTTVIRTNDNFEIAIPNSEFVSGRIINYSLSDPKVRVRIPFGVSYQSDPKKVKEVLLRVAKEAKDVLKDPPPRVWFYEMGDSALIFYLLVWVDIRKFWRMRALRSEIYFRAWEELKKEGIEIPFPQRDVWFKNPLRVEIDERTIHEGGHKGG